jgi:hypothetical protein
MRRAGPRVAARRSGRLGILTAMQRSQRCLVSITVALTLLIPGVAAAQSDGVTFDDGPSSKEYAIPLDAARGATKTKAPAPKPEATTPAPAATTPAPATPSASATSSKPKPKPDTKKQSTTTTQTAAPVVTTQDPPTTAATPVSTPAASDGTGPGVVIGGLALAAIALGGLAGLVLRRRRKPTDEY